MKAKTSKLIRDMSSAELSAEMEATCGLAPPPSDAGFERWAEYEVTSNFLIEARAGGDPEKIKRDAAEWTLQHHASKLELLVPHIERALGRELLPEEVSGKCLWQ